MCAGDRGPSAQPASIRLRAYARLVELARDERSLPHLLKAALEPVATCFDAPLAAVSARLGSEVVDAEWTRDEAHTRFFKGVVHRAITQCMEGGRPVARLYRAREAGARVAVLAAPLVKPDGSPLGAIAVVVPGVGSAELPGLAPLVESLAHLASALAARFQVAAADPGAGVGAARDLARAAGFRNPRELAFAIANSLRNQIGAEQVALGVGRRSRVEILAISGYDEIRDESPGVQAIRAAMEECLDTGDRIVCQREGPWSDEPVSTGHLLHRQWHEASSGSSVCSVPVPCEDGGTVLLLSLRRPMGEPWRRSDLDRIQELVAPYAGAFALLERAGRTLFEHAAESARELLRQAARAESRARTLAAAAAALGLVWFVFGTLPYRVAAPAVLEPGEVRRISAPFDAVIAESVVVAGDRVRRGQLLARLEDEDLRLERDRIRAELELERVAAAQALADGSAVEAELARARAEILRARLAILERRIERAVLRAPFDGVVVQGDLRRRVGESVPMGAELFQVAEDGHFVAQIRVPEHAIAAVEPGQSGEFASYARPDQTGRLEVLRVVPAAEATGSRKAYRVEASLELDRPWVRSGIEGVARIDAGSRPAWWVCLHRFTDWLRLRLWI